MRIKIYNNNVTDIPIGGESVKGNLNLAYPEFTGELPVVTSREYNRILGCLVRRPDEVHRFIDKGEAASKRGPGDPDCASYAFDIYDFANGVYRYRI